MGFVNNAGRVLSLPIESMRTEKNSSLKFSDYQSFITRMMFFQYLTSYSIRVLSYQLPLKVIFILRHCSNIPSNTRYTRYINKIWVQVCFGACFKRKLSNTFNCLKDLKFFLHSWRQRDKNICNSDLTNILDQLKASCY